VGRLLSAAVGGAALILVLLGLVRGFSAGPVGEGVVGPTWTVETMVRDGTMSAVPDRVTATIVFRDDGDAAVDDGCNTGGGPYVVDGASLRFGDILMTGQACEGPGLDVWDVMHAVLHADAITYSIDGGVLTMTAGDDGLVLRGERAP
jgi:heat shock protein HslJ